MTLGTVRILLEREAQLAVGKIGGCDGTLRQSDDEDGNVRHPARSARIDL